MKDSVKYQDNVKQTGHANENIDSSGNIVFVHHDIFGLDIKIMLNCKIFQAWGCVG